MSLATRNSFAKGLQKPLLPRRLRVRVVFADRSVSTGLKICVQGCPRFYRDTTDLSTGSFGTAAQ